MLQALDLAPPKNAVSMPACDGEILFVRGEPCGQTLEVRRGIARAVAYSRHGDRQIMAFFFAGDFIGLPLSNAHRYSAEAVNDLSVVRHSSRHFEFGLSADASRHSEIAAAIWREEEAFIARGLILGRVGVQARTAAFLRYFCQNLEIADGIFNFAIPQGDIASYLATSPETICRTLRRFREKGLIAMPFRNRLQILDRQRLDMLADVH